MNPPSTVGELRIDLGALQANWRRFGALASASTVAAMVKADAYGLGVTEVAAALSAVGCHEFFVAEPGEGIRVRAALPEADVFVLSGVAPGTEHLLERHRLTPVLVSLEQVKRWSAHARARAVTLAASVHFDTAMNRTGLDRAETDELLDDPEALTGLQIVHVMSHLACADEPSHELNSRQRERFSALRRRLVVGRGSLANSAGVGLGADFHFDHVRPGVGLYGVDPTPGRCLGLSPVVSLSAPVVQIRTTTDGDTVGYGATARLGNGRRLATIAAGYGDGYPRSLSNRGEVAFGGHRAPIVGRVSMDLTTVDVTDLPDGLHVGEGTMAELIGPTITIDEVAAAAGTIAYEVLTNLGRRYTRSYNG